MFTACSDDKVDEKEMAIHLDYNQENASSWVNYAAYAAQLLVNDAKTLNDSWSKGYKEGEAFGVTFKKANSKYPTLKNAVVQIIDGCVEISNEVGETKIGDPLTKWLSGRRTEALYAVEPWYSWHSRHDYTNNIYSIRNAFYGNRTGVYNKDTQTAPSLLGFIYSKDAALAAQVDKAIAAAAKAIQDIPQPFRNNIGSKEAKAAQDACAALNELLDKKVKPLVSESNTAADEAEFTRIVSVYVDNVVLPTYADLERATLDLKAKIDALKAQPSNAAFKAAAESWIAARTPWETSEAFLFGPVADLGLDPNMDSWPLDQVGIVNVLKSGKYDALNWSGDFDEDNKAIGAAQGLRGFHTLEYLLFKDGMPRTIK